MPQSTVLVPRVLAPAPAVENSLEIQSLEFFFRKTSPQLAGFFGGPFFQGSVLQLCLAEPAIRQATSAIGFLHEQIATGKFSLGGEKLQNVHLQLYNRSIRSVIDKAATGLTAFPLVATANILFTCLEIFRGDVPAAKKHIKNGINLLRAWRERNGAPRRTWGKKYPTFEACFMETEIAPVLSLFNTNVVECGIGGRTDLMLNPVDECGRLLLANQFENLNEARVGLIDIITHATLHCGQVENGLLHRRYSDVEAFVVSNSVQQNLERWVANVDDLIHRKWQSWSTKEKQVADVISIISLSTRFGTRSCLVENESAWDSYRHEYEELIRLAESIVSDHKRFPDSLSRTLSLDLGMIFPLHAVAWKCRWPKLRRKGLDLLLRIPRREWLFEAKHYHQIFSRIMNIEEEHLGLEFGSEPDEYWLPPENVRIHDFMVTPQPTSSIGPPGHAVTFWSKPEGLDGPWSRRIEIIHLESSQPVEAAIPTNMIGRKLKADT